MIMLPSNAGNASAATNLTIAFAKLADVIIDIKTSNLKKGQTQNVARVPDLCATQGARGYSRNFLPGPLEFLRIHPGFNFVEIDPSACALSSFANRVRSPRAPRDSG